MNAETIKDFLVSLGFSVDDAGAKNSVLSSPVQLQMSSKWGWPLKELHCPWWPLRLRLPPAWIIFTGRHSALARQSREFSLLAMRFRRLAAAWTLRDLLWKASPGLFVTIPGQRDF